MFNVLADDKAGPEKWLDSAKALMTPEGELFEPRWMFFRYGRIANNKIKVVAEPLRAKKDPTLTELLLKRIEQGTEFTQSASLALLLAEWDPKASLKPLADLMKRIGDHDGDSMYLQVLRDTAKNIESPPKRLVEEKQDRRHWLNLGSGFDASANFAVAPASHSTTIRLVCLPKPPDWSRSPCEIRLEVDQDSPAMINACGCASSTPRK